MFLRRHRKEAGGEDYEYWSLVKTIRTARGPRHQIVARLGKLDGAEVQAARGWEDLDALLEGSMPSRQLSLTPESASEPLWKEIDVRGVKVERLRQFGRVYLGLALWRRLGLHRLAAMEDKYGQAKRVWVFDRGIVSEENLEWLRQRGAIYLVGTPQSQMNKHQAALLDQPVKKLWTSLL